MRYARAPSLPLSLFAELSSRQKTLEGRFPGASVLADISSSPDMLKVSRGASSDPRPTWKDPRNPFRRKPRTRFMKGRRAEFWWAVSLHFAEQLLSQMPPRALTDAGGSL